VVVVGVFVVVVVVDDISVGFRCLCWLFLYCEIVNVWMLIGLEDVLWMVIVVVYYDVVHFGFVFEFELLCVLLRWLLVSVFAYVNMMLLMFWGVVVGLMLSMSRLFDMWLMVSVFVVIFYGWCW